MVCGERLGAKVQKSVVCCGVSGEEIFPFKVAAPLLSYMGLSESST